METGIQKQEQTALPGEHAVRIMHVRKLELIDGRHHICKQVAPYGGMTLAYIVRDGYLVVSVARCHPRDRYVKREGARIARERLLSAAPQAAAAVLPLPYTGGLSALEGLMGMLEGDVSAHEALKALAGATGVLRARNLRRTLRDYATCRPDWRRNTRTELRHGVVDPARDIRMQVKQ